MPATLGANDFIHGLTMRARFFMMRWRLALTPPLGGIDNMAIDAALLERARATAEGVVRVYGWSQPTLSFGRNQRALHLARQSTGSYT